MTPEQAQRIRAAPLCEKHEGDSTALFWADDCDDCLALVVAAAQDDAPNGVALTACWECKGYQEHALSCSMITALPDEPTEAMVEAAVNEWRTGINGTALRRCCAPPCARRRRQPMADLDFDGHCESHRMRWVRCIECGVGYTCTRFEDHWHCVACFDGTCNGRCAACHALHRAEVHADKIDEAVFRG